MSENKKPNNSLQDDLLFMGTPDDDITQDDYEKITGDDPFFLAPVDDFDDDYYENDESFVKKLLKRKKKKKADVPKVRKFSDSQYEIFPENLGTLADEEQIKHEAEEIIASTISESTPGDIAKVISEAVAKAESAEEETEKLQKEAEEKAKLEEEKLKKEAEEKAKLEKERLEKEAEEQKQKEELLQKAAAENARLKAEKLQREKEEKEKEKKARLKEEQRKKAEKSSKPGSQKKAQEKKSPSSQKSAKQVKAKPQKAEQSSFMFMLTVTFKLFLICTIVAALLALANYITAPIIAQNQLEAKQAALASIFPELTGYDTLPSDSNGVNEIYIIKSDDDYIGYAADISTDGYGGVINMLVGVDNNANIVGIEVISHSETAGVGTKVLDPEYLSNYNNLGKTELVLNQDVDAVSKATVSSKAVNNGVNNALKFYDSMYKTILNNTTEVEA